MNFDAQNDMLDFEPLLVCLSKCMRMILKTCSQTKLKELSLNVLEHGIDHSNPTFTAKYVPKMANTVNFEPHNA